jgi:hypothetical protein
MEAVHQRGQDKSVDLLIAGFLYTVDFEQVKKLYMFVKGHFLLYCQAMY